MPSYLVQLKKYNMKLFVSILAVMRLLNTIIHALLAVAIQETVNLKDMQKAACVFAYLDDNRYSNCANFSQLDCNRVSFEVAIQCPESRHVNHFTGHVYWKVSFATQT